MATRTVRAVGELALIKQCRALFARGTVPGGSVEVGIGDDAAVLRLPAAGRSRRSGRERLLFASDMIVEGVHFQRRLVPAPWIGWKALASNISDIAAMGGIPKWAVVSVGLPPSTPVRFVKGLQAGLALRGIVSSAIDISDGLLQDLSHICVASGVGAQLATVDVPVADGANLDQALNGGDDYELCFTVPAQLVDHLPALGVAATQIGLVVTKSGIELDGEPVSGAGYRHFQG